MLKRRLTLLFKTIPRDSTLTERAQEQIENLILDRALGPEDRLPSERELAQMLGVSRTVIREAIRLLAAKGLVAVRTGSGTYVRILGADIMKAPMDLLLRAGALKIEDIHEVRAVLEIRIAELAANHATDDDLQRMEETIQRLRKRNISAMEYATADVAFHCYLAAATQNPLLLALVNSINDVMIEVRLRAAYSLGDVSRERAIYYHSKILDCVRARDVVGAHDAMVEHLAFAAKALPLLAQVTGKNTVNRNQVVQEREDLEAT